MPGTYHFEYAATSNYDSSTLGIDSGGGGGGPVGVPICLQAGSYHFRAVIDTELATSAGVDQSFSTPPHIVGSLTEWDNDGQNGRDWNAYELLQPYDHLITSPTAIVDAWGGERVYGIDGDGHILETEPINGVWSSFDLSDETGAPPMSGAVSVALDANGTEHIFSVSGGDLWETVDDFQNGDTWSAYDRTPYASAATFVGKPTAILDSAGDIRVYLLDTDGHINEVNQQPGSIWPEWDLNDQTGGPAMMGCDVSVIPGNPQEIYSVSAFGHLIETVPDGQAGRTWNAYDLTPTLSPPIGAPLVGAPSAIDVNGSPRAYTLDTDGHVIETMVTSNGWQTFDLNDQKGGPQMVGGLSAITDAAGTQHIYGISAAGVLIEVTPSGQGGRLWNAYDHGYVGGPMLAGTPSAMLDSSHNVRVYTTKVG